MIEHLKVRDNIMEGLREGRVEGLKEGRIEGRKQGLNEGRIEGAQQKAIEATKNLLEMNVLTPEQIALAEGIPLEKVLELQDQVSNKS